MEYVKPNPTKKGKDNKDDFEYKDKIGFVIVTLIFFLLVSYTWHCTWVTSEAYSSPSIVLAARQQDGLSHNLKLFICLISFRF